MFRAETLWISVFLAIGAIGGLVYNWPDANPNDPAATVELESAPESDPAPQELPIGETGDAKGDVRDNPQPVLDDPNATSGIWSDVAPNTQRSQPIDFGVLELGDRLLMGGNSIGAFRHYSKLWQRANLPLDSSVLIRLGLSSELGGLHEQAEKHYRSAIRVSEKGSVQQLASLLGTARIWERDGQLDDAISLLSELYLMHTNERSPELVRQSILRQLADCLQKRLIATEVVRDALQTEPMEYHWCPITIRPILEQADLEQIEDQPQSFRSGIKVLQNPRGDVSLILVEARVSGFGVLQLMSELERQTGLKMEVTGKASSAMVGRLTNIDSSAMPVSLLLDQTLESMLLSWSQSGETITVMHRDELSSRDAASFDLARAQRMLQQVQLNFPNGIERTAALMNDGNNSRLSGGWEVAAEKYRTARESSPTNELNAKLFFNEATLGLVQGEKLDSLHSCYMALDQTLAASLQGHVYAMIADLELELGQPGKAITAAARGLRRTEEPQIRSRTVMTLARAYLLSDDPSSANRVLFDHSANLTDARSRRLASVYSSYARFQRTEPKHGLQDEGQRLVMALAVLDPKDVTSYADALIVSEAFSSIGLRSKATDSLRRALEVAPSGYWNERIRFSLVEMLYESADLDGANQVVESFESVSAERLPKVLFLHASIQLDLGNLENCEAICRRILGSEVDEATKSKTLQKLGEVLGRSGDHYAAALCFAGLLPEQSDNQNANSSVRQ